MNDVVKRLCERGGACLAAYAILGTNLSCAIPFPVPAPAPVVGAVGGPIGLAAAGLAYGGYLLFKRRRDRR